MTKTISIACVIGVILSGCSSAPTAMKVGPDTYRVSARAHF